MPGLFVLLFLIMPITAMCGLQISTTPTTLTSNGACDLAGSISFTLVEDDFPHRDMGPVYIRLNLEAHAFLCRTLVDIEDSESGHQPIFLALSTPDKPGVTLQAPPDVLSIVRWRAGERAIWVAVNGSSQDWILRDNVAGPPDEDHPVTFTLGLSANQSRDVNQAAHDDGRANLPGNFRDGQVADTSLHVDLSQSIFSDFHYQFLPELGFFMYGNYRSEGVTTHEQARDIDPGPGGHLGFSNNSIVGQSAVDSSRQWLPWIPASGGFHAMLELSNPTLETREVTLRTPGFEPREVTLSPRTRIKLQPHDLFPQISGPFPLHLEGLVTPAVLMLTNPKYNKPRVMRSIAGAYGNLVYHFSRDLGDLNALVLLNTGVADAEASLVRVDPDGSVTLLDVRPVLKPGQPQALILDQIPGAETAQTILVSANQTLVGVSFTFDSFATTHMTAAEPALIDTQAASAQ